MYSVITEVKWTAKVQKGEGTARVKDILTIFLLPDSEQTLFFGSTNYRPCTTLGALIFIISFDPHIVKKKPCPWVYQ